jgi:hypothetical protein
VCEEYVFAKFKLWEKDYVLATDNRGQIAWRDNIIAAEENKKRQVNLSSCVMFV